MFLRNNNDNFVECHGLLLDMTVKGETLIELDNLSAQFQHNAQVPMYLWVETMNVNNVGHCEMPRTEHVDDAIYVTSLEGRWR